MRENSYSIGEAAKLCGLPESTLRYYEQVGLIDFIGRNEAKRRVYNEKDIRILRGISCMHIAGITLEEMKSYFQAFNFEEEAIDLEKIDIPLGILKNKLTQVKREKKLNLLREKYLKLKIRFRELTKEKQLEEREKVIAENRAIGEKLQKLGGNTDQL